MDWERKHGWKVALFAMKIVLLTGWAFSTGLIYQTSKLEYLASSLVSAVGFIGWPVWERARIL